jgi:5-methyltetrahydrofolate--homocysteine methyltransferase
MAIQDIFNAVMGFDGDRVADLVTEELEKKTELSRILNEGLIRAMDEVGRRFAAGDYFLPEMLQAARAMKAGMEVLRPRIASGTGEKKGTIVIATVKGDLHDIGKNLVAMMLEGAGFEVINLGVDVGAEGFLRSAEKHTADIVCMSALLTTTRPAMAATVRILQERCPRTRTMVGGASVTRGFAEQVGATAYSADAPGAVEEARRIMAGLSERSAR